MAPSGKAVDVARTPEINGHKNSEDDGGGSSRSSSRSTSGRSSSNAGSSSGDSSGSSRDSSSGGSSSNAQLNTDSGTIKNHSKLGDLSEDSFAEGNHQRGHTRAEDPSGGADDTRAQGGHVNGGSGRGEARNAEEMKEKIRGGAPASHNGSREIGRRLSNTSVASASSRSRREETPSSAAALASAVDARVRTGRILRPGSTQGTAAASRLEVCGQLEVTNVSSAQEMLQLLEDTSSPLSLQLHNVELRVGPTQSVRLGQAVPALREHLRGDLERQMRETGGPEVNAQARVPTAATPSVSRTGSNRHTSDILLTGTVVGSFHPTLLSSRAERGVGAHTAEAAAVSHPAGGGTRREAALLLRRIPSTVHHAVPAAAAVSAAGQLPDAAAGTSSGLGAPSATVAPATVSAVAAEQAQPQRASAGATSLVQQILEVQGQVKSLLAEEGLASAAAEVATLKKKGAQKDVTEDRERPAGNLPERSQALRGSNVAARSHDEEVERGDNGGSSSSGVPMASDVGSSSGSRTFARGILVKTTAATPQGSTALSSTLKAVSAGMDDTDGKNLIAPHASRHEERHSVSEDVSHTAAVEAKPTAARGDPIAEKEKAEEKVEPDGMKREITRETGEQGGSTSEAVSGDRPDTSSARALNEVTAEKPPHSETDAKRIPETQEAAGGGGRLRQYESVSGTEKKGDAGTRVAEEKLKSRTDEKVEEAEPRGQGRTQPAQARDGDSGTTTGNKTSDTRAPPVEEKEEKVEKEPGEEPKVDQRTPSGTEGSAGSTTRGGGAQPQRAAVEEKEENVGKEPGEEPKVDQRTPAGTEESAGSTTEEKEEKVEKEPGEEPKVDQRTPSGTEESVGSTTRGGGAQLQRAAVEDKEEKVEKEPWEEPKVDQRTPSGTEESAGSTTRGGGAQPQRAALEETEEKVEKEFGEEPKVDQRTPAGTEESAGSTTRGGGAQLQRAAVEDNEDKVEKEPREEPKVDQRTPSGTEESAGSTTRGGGAQPQRAAGTQAVGEEKEGSTCEPGLDLSKADLDGSLREKGSEALLNHEKQRPQTTEDAEAPLGTRRSFTDPTSGDKLDSGGMAQSAVAESKEQHRHEDKKSATNSSEVQEEGTAAAAASEGPSFVQALAKLFTWGAAADESQTQPTAAEDVEVNRSPIEAKADKKTAEAPPTVPGQASAPVAPAGEAVGENSEEYQGKKKARPKLMPKPPPARLAQVKRDTDTET